MNKLIVVNEGDADTRYDIVVNSDFLGIRDYFGENHDFSLNKYAKICIVTDSNVAKLYLDDVKSTFEGICSSVYTHVFTAGEASKNFSTLNKLYEDLIINHFDRYDLLVALGGGVVGDLCGYCAATYLRGIDYIQMPTTLLSQVDSSVGGKTAIDFMQYKNMVGAFYMPKLVYINVNVLSTLDDVQFASGMGEVIKHGLIRDKKYYNYIDDNRTLIAEKDPEALMELIYGSLIIKTDVVMSDPTEKGIRAYLNFGHTIGHAVEKLCDYRLAHGMCVAIGMIGAMYISNKLGYISEDECDDALELIEYFDLPSYIDSDSIACEDILMATKSDKKMVGDKIKFVVLEEIGKAKIRLDVDDKLLFDAISHICR